MKKPSKRINCSASAEVGQTSHRDRAIRMGHVNDSASEKRGSSSNLNKVRFGYLLRQISKPFALSNERNNPSRSALISSIRKWSTHAWHRLRHAGRACRSLGEGNSEMDGWAHIHVDTFWLDFSVAVALRPLGRRDVSISPLLPFSSLPSSPPLARIRVIHLTFTWARAQRGQ